MNISKSIRIGMQLKGYKTQQQLADSVGMSQVQISYLLTGKIVNSRRETLSKLACAFDVQVSEFIKWGEE